MKKLYNRMYSAFQTIFVDEEMDAEAVRKHENLVKPLFRLLISAMLVAVGILVIDLLNIAFFVQERQLGPFGDFFGGVVNPVFTFLTFFGLIITIVIQRMELRLARNEYKETSGALKTQGMETTFFNILDLHHTIVEGLRFNPNIFPETEEEKMIRYGTGATPSKSTVSGRNVFGAVVRQITAGRNPSSILERYKMLQEHHNHVLGHYFRNLYHALKVIDGYHDLSIEQKRKYASILRAQLSSNELLLLLFNCLDGMVDRGQFKNLLIRYRMLEHAPLVYLNGYYQAADIPFPIVEQSQVDQFIEEKLIPTSMGDIPKGAFGTNTQIVVNRLKR